MIVDPEPDNVGLKVEWESSCCQIICHCSKLFWSCNIILESYCNICHQYPEFYSKLVSAETKRTPGKKYHLKSWEGNHCDCPQFTIMLTSTTNLIVDCAYKNCQIVNRLRKCVLHPLPFVLLTVLRKIVKLVWSMRNIQYEANYLS